MRRPSVVVARDAPTERDDRGRDASADLAEDCLQAALSALRPLETRDANVSSWDPRSRRCLMAAVDDVLSGPWPLAWLVGEDGVGKSACAAAVAVECGAAAVHFCRSCDAATRDAGTIVLSLAAQLLRSVAGYCVCSAAARPRDGESPAAHFRRVVVLPLMAIAESTPRGRLLLVIDGLNEAAGPDGRNCVLEMLRAVAACPPWLKVFVTSTRPPAAGDGLRECARVIPLDAGSPENVGDVRAALSSVLAPLADGGMPLCCAIDALLARSGGKFLYVHLLRGAVAGADGTAARSLEYIDELPDDTEACLREGVSAVADAGDACVTRALEVIAASFEPLPFNAVAAAACCADAAACFAALARSRVCAVLSGGRVAPAHPLARELLLAPDAAGGHSRVDPARGHRALAVWTRSHLFGGTPPACRDVVPASATDRYACMYHVEHCMRAAFTTSERHAALTAALRDVAFLDGVIRCGAGGALVRQLHSLAFEPAMRDALRPFALWMFDAAGVWATDAVAALGPAACGAFGDVIAARALEWAAWRVPVLGDVRVVSSPAARWPQGTSSVPLYLPLPGGVAGPAQVASVSADGAQVLLSGADGALIVRDAASGHLVRAIQLGSSRVWSVAHAAAGGCVAASCDDGAVFVWRGDDEGARALRGHDGRVACVRFSEDGVRLVTAGFADGTVRVWDAASGDCAHVLRGHEGGVLSAAFAPAGAGIVVSGGEDGTVRLWDASTGGPRGILRSGGGAAVTSVAFSPHGAHVAAALSSVIHVWDIVARRLVATLSGHSSSVLAIAFSTDGSRIASGDDDGTIRLWSADPFACVRVLCGHAAAVAAVCFFPDGVRLASACTDGAARVWDIAPCEDDGVAVAAESARPRVLAVRPSPDGRLVAVAGDDCCVTVRLAGAGTAVAERAGERWVWSVAWSPDGARVVSGDEGGAVVVWAVGAGAGAVSMEGHTARVSCVCFAPDGRTIASGSDDRSVRLWDAATGSPQHAITGHTDPVYALAFSPDGAFLATASDFCSVWNVARGAIARGHAWHARFARAVCWSPDGDLVASGGEDNVVTVCRVTAGGVRRMARAHGAAVRAVCFSPDGTRVVSGDDNGVVLVSEVSSGACVAAVVLPNAVWHLNWQRGVRDLDTVFAGFFERAALSHTLLVFSGRRGPFVLPRCPPGEWRAGGGAAACPLCARQFSPFRFWKRRCYCCGGVFCSPCTVVPVGCRCAFCAGSSDRRVCALCARTHDVCVTVARGDGSGSAPVPCAAPRVVGFVPEPWLMPGDEVCARAAGRGANKHKQSAFGVTNRARRTPGAHVCRGVVGGD